MIEIDLLDSKLSVSHPTNLVSLQLAFLCFQKTKNEDWIFNSEEFNTVLEKIILFMDSNDIKYKISHKVKEAMEKRKNLVNDFSSRKKTLLDFKMGKFDEVKYKVFMDFLSNKIPRQLKEHQKKSAFHLLLAKHGANFSVPGSGKTTVVLSVYEKLRLEGVVNTLFVIGPPSSFGPWRKEFESTLGRTSKYTILAGGNKHSRTVEYHPTDKTKSELYLSTFHTVLNDQKEAVKLLSSDYVKAFVVVDEAHYIKKLNGSWSSAVLKLSKSSVIRCVLTGTPLPKSYGDIFNLFDFLWPDGSVIDENTRNKILAAEENKDDQTAKVLVKENFDPLFYRVRKIDLNLTRPIFHKPIQIKMNNYESLVYKSIENKIMEDPMIDEYNDLELVYSLRRGRMMRLRQAASYTKLLETALPEYREVLYDPNSDIGEYIHNYDEHEKPAKLEHLLKLIGDIRAKGKKIIIRIDFFGSTNAMYSI